MNEVNRAIDYVRQQRGLSPLPDPHIIQGFGPDDPPAPSTPVPSLPMPRAPEGDPYGLDMGAESQPPQMARAASPLLAIAKPAEPASSRLLVQDAQAHYQGMDVRLTDKDVQGISKIVLQAVERNVREQLKAVQAQIPRRVYDRKRKRSKK